MRACVCWGGGCSSSSTVVWSGVEWSACLLVRVLGWGEGTQLFLQKPLQVKGGSYESDAVCAAIVLTRTPGCRTSCCCCRRFDTPCQPLPLTGVLMRLPAAGECYKNEVWMVGTAEHPGHCLSSCLRCDIWKAHLALQKGLQAGKVQTESGAAERK